MQRTLNTTINRSKSERDCEFHSNGPKWFVAHSLGNMLVSAAAQDWGMQYERYFMLNAAVPVEAYDATAVTMETRASMTPSLWSGYAERLKAVNWRGLFASGDARSSLTWQGRFACVSNIVNYYSSEEEVLKNGSGNDPLPGREYAWYYQETHKGRKPYIPIYNMGRNEGGWVFNRSYDTVTNPDPGNSSMEIVEHMPPADAAELTDEQLRHRQFFLDFHNPGMYTSPDGAVIASNYLYRAEMLAYAIPSESYAVGANPLSCLNAYTNSMTNESVPSRNFNMADFTAEKQEGWTLLYMFYCICLKAARQ